MCGQAELNGPLPIGNRVCLRNTLSALMMSLDYLLLKRQKDVVAYTLAQVGEDAEACGTVGH